MSGNKVRINMDEKVLRFQNLDNMTTLQLTCMKLLDQQNKEPIQ